MDEATKQLEAIDAGSEAGRYAIAGPNVVPFPMTILRRTTMPDGSPLTPAENIEIRAALVAIRKLLAADGCPVARSIVQG